MCVAYPSELKRVIGTSVAGVRESEYRLQGLDNMRGEHVVAALVLDICRDNACNEDSYA